MYRSAMSTRLSLGRSTPAIRAISLLSLSLLVPRVRADHADRPAPADHLALLAHLLHGRPNLHRDRLEITCTGTRSCRAPGRTATAPPGPGPPAGSGCSASASCPRCGPTRCARSPVAPGTSRSGAARSPYPRPRSRLSSASSGRPSLMDTPDPPAGESEPPPVGGGQPVYV